MNTYNTLTPLQFWLRIFSLHNISNTKQGLIFNKCPYFKIILILLCFGFLMAYNLFLHYTTELMKNLSPSVVIVDTVDLVLCYFEYIVDLCFVYKYGNEMCTYFNNYDEMDTVFKMKYYKVVQKSVMAILVIFLPSWFLSSVGQYTVWVWSGGFISPTTYAVSYFMFLIRSLSAFDLISQTMHVRLRLKTITDHIEDYTSFADDSTNRIKTIKNTWGNLAGIQNTKVIPFVTKFRCEIAKTSSYYLLLVEQTKFLNRFFGVRMLMHCLYTLAEMITFVNFVAKVINGTMISVMSSYVLLAPNILRLVNCVGVLTSLVYHCEACCHECSDITDAVNRLLVNKRISEDTQLSLKTLRKLVTSRPLKFTAAGFFNLESTLLLSIISVVITYALVLIQSTQ